MRRIDCQRRQNRKNATFVVGRQRLARLLAEFGPAHDAHTIGRQRRQQIGGQQPFLLRCKFLYTSGNLA